MDCFLYEKPDISDHSFPIYIGERYHNTPGAVYYNHWHEGIELLYFTEGKAVVRCNSNSMEVNPGDLVIVNSSEIHSIENSGGALTYFCIIIDSSLIRSNITDTCELKYITPINQNLILFKNKVCNDTRVTDLIKKIIHEHDIKDIGYELAVKSLVYMVIVLLLRNYVEVTLTEKEYQARYKNLQRLDSVLKFIDNNYSQKITIDKLAELINISTFHFCHIFKNVIGTPVSEYLNRLRISKADHLLKTTGMTITEIAMATGFSDSNYFSRLYKKYKNLPPSSAKNCT